MSNIFNIQNSINVTSAMQNIQAGLVNESRVQHSSALQQQAAEVASNNQRIKETQESAATVDLSHNESSQRSLYTPLPRKHKGEDEDEPGEDRRDDDGQSHIDITV